MNNKNVFNTLQMNNSKDIMNAFDKMLQQTQLLVEDINEGDKQKRVSFNKEKNSHIKNPQERKLVNDIENLLNSPLEGEQFPFNHLNKVKKVEKAKSNKPNNMLPNEKKKKIIIK